MNYANIFAKMFPERNFCKVNMFPERNFCKVNMFPERNFQVYEMFPEREIDDQFTHCYECTTNKQPFSEPSWQVELFFKWLKQHLQIKKFWGTSENVRFLRLNF